MDTGGRNRSGHKSVCTWLTMHTVGLSVHSGVRNGMPLHTSTTTSQSRARRRWASGARTNWVYGPPLRTTS